MEELVARVTGRVQFVGFRDFVQRKARGLSIVGVVENRDDGSLFIIAQGEHDALERLIEHLHKGPFLARVMKVETELRTPSQTFKGFKIVY